MLNAQVIETVHDLARKNRKRFRASYVAGLVGLPIDVVDRNLLSMVQLGELVVNFEVMCPDTGETLDTFGLRQDIPQFYAHDECCGGAEFEVTPRLIWVTYSPTDELKKELSSVSASAPAPALGDDPPGNRRGPRRSPPSRATRTGSMRFSTESREQRRPEVPVWFTSISGINGQSQST